MKKTFFLLLVAAFCMTIITACFINETNRIGNPNISHGSAQPLIAESDVDIPENTPEKIYPAMIDLPKTRYAENMRGEIINNAEIDYEYKNDCLTFNADENNILTIEAFDADGVRLNCEVRYPGELNWFSSSLSNHKYAGVEVLRWYLYLDPVVIDEQFGQPRFSEKTIREYQVVLAESEE